MFTGIVEETGLVLGLEPKDGGIQLVVSASVVVEGTRPGDSISVSGVCLTVEKAAKDRFTAFLSPETIEKSTLGGMSAGTAVNLERALALGDRFGGHLVSGHVEATGTIREMRKEGASHRLVVSCGPDFVPYIVAKGSVSVDGVSLTIVEKMDRAFSVSLIPETFEKTTFRLKTAGNFVNLEPDLILKYVMSVVRNLGGDTANGSLTFEKLKDSGFIPD